jgi:hypothetical protein
MDESEDLARRFLGLWGDYLTALAAEPKTAELVQSWLAFGTAPLRTEAGGEDGNGTGTEAPAGARRGAASAAAASRQRADVVDELARRIDELEKRIAALEAARRPAGRTRARNRSTWGR